MKTYQILKIGEYHLDFCEDYGTIQKFGEDKLLAAVMDGSTMGNESYFIATLLGKIVKKILKEKNYKEFYGEIEKTINNEDEIKFIIKNIFNELKYLKNYLLLEKDELLSTLVILLIDTKTKEGIVMVFGDAIIGINGKIIRFEQNNQPDYLAYHLGKNFEDWWNEKKQIINVNNCQDISIATDGIDSFEKMDNDNKEMIDVIDFLLNDMTLLEKKEMLNIKVKKLETQFALKPTDDIAIIRIIAKD